MPRPAVDAAVERRRILEAVETKLKRYGAARITVTEAAAACGMSQSNAYRFFPSKQALMAAVADRWFAEVEAACTAIAGEPGPAIDRLARFLLAQYRLKRARLDADPRLFAAYLDLAAANPAAVTGHVARLSELLRRLVAQAVREGHFEHHAPRKTADLIKAATISVCDPWQILQRRQNWTDADTTALIAATLGGLDQAPLPARTRLRKG